MCRIKFGLLLLLSYFSPLLTSAQIETGNTRIENFRSAFSDPTNTPFPAVSGSVGLILLSALRNPEVQTVAARETPRLAALPQEVLPSAMGESNAADSVATHLFSPLVGILINKLHISQERIRNMSRQELSAALAAALPSASDPVRQEAMNTLSAAWAERHDRASFSEVVSHFRELQEYGRLYLRSNESASLEERLNDIRRQRAATLLSQIEESLFELPDDESPELTGDSRKSAMFQNIEPFVRMSSDRPRAEMSIDRRSWIALLPDRKALEDFDFNSAQLLPVEQIDRIHRSRETIEETAVNVDDKQIKRSAIELFANKAQFTIKMETREILLNAIERIWASIEGAWPLIPLNNPPSTGARKLALRLSRIIADGTLDRFYAPIPQAKVKNLSRKVNEYYRTAERRAKQGVGGRATLHEIILPWGRFHLIVSRTRVISDPETIQEGSGPVIRASYLLLDANADDAVVASDDLLFSAGSE